jgi:aminoglycoside phosphotransferase (APT) family kinase protein
MNLQPLFSEPILHQHSFDDVHPGQASSVWLVQTDSEEVVVRTTRMHDYATIDFWWGCHHLFGIDPTDVFALQPMNDLLQGLSTIAVPKVLRTRRIDGVPYVILEKMQGDVVRSFNTLPLHTMNQLGQSLAQIHRQRYDQYGHPTGTYRYPLASFHGHMAATMRGVGAHFYSHDRAVASMLEEMCSLAEVLPSPDFGSLIMMDMDPTQFLSNGTQLTAMVDTEVYAIGPRELDFIALEYLLEADHARAFAEGYAMVLNLPNLSAVRPVYRYFNRLLAVQGHVDFSAWMNWPSALQPFCG